MANGYSVTTASRKMMVRPANKMFSAISFGVFCRSAPSTRAIMRSRKVSPGFDVTFTLIWSESTRVPPVTAERSPPDSRMTGADSPVMADSSTEATPSIISPSDGTNSPADTRTTSPARSFELCTCSVRSPSTMRFAMVSARAFLSVSACALPRPSAMASAKLANSTVNHSHSVICKLKPKFLGSRSSKTVAVVPRAVRQHGEPQPQCDLQIKAKILGVAEQQNGGEHTANFHDEHDRVTHHVTWIQLDKRIQDRAPHDLALPDRSRFRFISCHVGSLRKSCLPPSAGAQGLVPG